MLVFNFILILFAAILLSNLINRFLPMLSLPIVQIILGAMIAIIPFGIFGFEFHLEPELFFVLFLTPLIFKSTVFSDKRGMRKTFKPIIMAAVALVFVAVIIIGYLTHWLVPVIPLAAAFALAASLCPTDIVAVEAVASRVPMPRRIFSILSGESTINDATGIVCFQFAVTAVITGSFVLMHGIARFFILAGGGLLVGLVITVLKYLLLRWLHSLSINNQSLHVFIGMLTPFIIYLIAEEVGVSGILAVFFSGMLHSLFRDKFNPEMVSLNKAQDSVWSFFSFSLDGLVFVILGTQLTQILQYGRTFDISRIQIIGCVLAISFAIIVIRFLWWILTVRKKYYSDSDYPISRIRSGMVFSVGGTRGAISLATAMSIPLMLPGDVPFPERELIILIASGVVTISLLITNFFLPLLIKRKAESSSADAEEAARVEILSTVTERIKNSATKDNLAATEIVIRNYQSRIKQHTKDNKPKDMYHSWDFGSEILDWEKDVFLRMAEIEQISKTTAEHYIEEIDKEKAECEKKNNTLVVLIKMVWHFIQSFTWKEPKLKDKDYLELEKVNAQMMQKTLDELNLPEDDPIAAIIAEEHEKVVSARLGIEKDKKTHLDYHRMIHDVAAQSLHIERVLIQHMLEEERLSWKTAKEMQANITLLEAQLQEQ
ncbi:MAG: sodium:proton antiporter [Oscillospiraceae bacterium]|nr:sodium:proton antiporter [Oscillospiraceae bacterium]